MKYKTENRNRNRKRRRLTCQDEPSTAAAHTSPQCQPTKPEAAQPKSTYRFVLREKKNVFFFCLVDNAKRLASHVPQRR
jgi:hypothetical protein